MQQVEAGLKPSQTGAPAAVHAASRGVAAPAVVLHGNLVRMSRLVHTSLQDAQAGMLLAPLMAPEGRTVCWC